MDSLQEHTDDAPIQHNRLASQVCITEGVGVASLTTWQHSAHITKGQGQVLTGHQQCEGAGTSTAGLPCVHNAAAS
jgi:hypothetical protein